MRTYHRGVYYFAYGSNMLRERLCARTPSAVIVGPARLAGHALRFHKRGADGSGKCDAYATGLAGDEVLGVLFRITAAELRRLDGFEGGYAGRRAEVTADDGVVSAYLYTARPHVIDPALRPFDWYRELVVAGARQHALPDRYVRRLEAVDAVPDPDPERARHYRSLLGRCRGR